MSLEPPRRACEMMLWFILFFAVAAFGATEWWSRAVLECLIFILAALCSVRDDFAPRSSNIIIGFAVVIGIGLIQSVNHHPVFGPAHLLPLTRALPQTLYAVLFWIAMAALVWSASGILRWDGALRRLSLAIIFIGLFISIVGLIQRGQGNIAYYGWRVIRPGTNPFGPFTNYNHAANWMVAATLIGASLFVNRVQNPRRVPLVDRGAQLCLDVFVLCIAVVAVIQTGSRGAINSFVFAVIISGGIAAGPIIQERARRSVALVLTVFAVAYGIFLYVHPKWIGLAGRMVIEDSAAYRISMYRSGLRMLADYPLWGIGLGGIQKVFPTYQEATVIGVVDRVHSSWLEIALESGVIGAVAVGFALLSIVFALGRVLIRAKGESRVVTLGFFAAIIAYLVHGVVECNFQIPANAALFCVLLAAAGAIRDSANLRSPLRQQSRSLRALVFVGLSIVSLIPGFSGATPRWNAPFMSNNDPLWLTPR